MVVAPNAYATGKALVDLNVNRSGVKIKGLRRDNIEMESPPMNMVLRAGDVLVISGKPRRVERAERYLLEGD